jgi:transcriptional regulator with XRE-family HTH domain
VCGFFFCLLSSLKSSLICSRARYILRAINSFWLPYSEASIFELLTSMPQHKLENYLRGYRRRAGLTQREVAYLLGLKARAPVCEMEKRRRMPLLRTALALEAIYGVPASELFAGMREEIASGTRARMKRLASEIAPKVGTKSRHEYREARKLAWLSERCTANSLDGSPNQASPRS